MGNIGKMDMNVLIFSFVTGSGVAEEDIKAIKSKLKVNQERQKEKMKCLQQQSPQTQQVVCHVSYAYTCMYVVYHQYVCIMRKLVVRRRTFVYVCLYASITLSHIYKCPPPHHHLHVCLYESITLSHTNDGQC